MTESIEQANRPDGAGDVAMTREKARVIAVEHRCLWVETFKRSTCGDCEASSACGQGALSRWFARRPQSLRVICGAGEAELYTVGQWVEIGIPEGVVAKVSVMVYLLPLMAMIVSGALMQSLLGNDLAVLTGLVAGFWIGLRLVRAYAERRENDLAFQPRLLSIAR